MGERPGRPPRTREPAMEAEPAVERLPEELLASIALHLADDDYHMLTLPLVCSALGRACRTPAVEAARLASRLRQVADSVAPAAEIDEWGLGHAWGALTAAQAFLDVPAPAFDSRIALLAAAPSGMQSLRLITERCAALEPPPPPAAKSAEALFLEVEAQRQAAAAAPALSLSARPASNALAPASLSPSLSAHHASPRAVRRSNARPGDIAAQKQAAALNLRGEARSAVAREMEAQAQRQLSAETRRRWRLLSGWEKREWEGHRLEGIEAWKRRCSVTATTAELATSVASRLRHVGLEASLAGCSLDDAAEPPPA